MQENDPGFLGRGWHFPPEFDPSTGEIRMAEAEEDVAESLRILMNTRPGERIMQPTYGCRIHDYVFEPNDSETQAGIETAVRQAILFFEPRITVHRIEAIMTDWLEGRIGVALDYTVNQTNTRSNMVYPFYIREGTLVSDTPVMAI
ncbi:GPW/gp25 family protein [Roseobacter sp. S98]|uniref:GPW/gp25 family protein n=1 Tax=Roseobacter algicola (ex Choi et al. 2025) (nom. illeg.) TaxID=3092138 RepID=UPI0035C66DBA